MPRREVGESTWGPVVAGLVVLAAVTYVAVGFAMQNPRYPVVPFGCELLPANRLATWVPHTEQVERSEDGRSVRCGWAGRTPGEGWVILYIQLERHEDAAAARTRRDQLHEAGRLAWSKTVCPPVGDDALQRIDESDEQISTWLSFYDSNVTVRVVYRSGGDGRLSRDVAETTAFDIARLIDDELRTARPPRWYDSSSDACQTTV